MMRGVVSPHRQPLVRIVVRGPQGQEETVEALVDSGYNGTLVLPSAIVTVLGLPFHRVRTVQVADGSLVNMSVHAGRVLWEGIERPVYISAMGNQAIVGMGFLLGCELCIEIVDGGEVIIRPLS